MHRPSTRRAAVDRWIASLTPMFEAVQNRARVLGLGEPRLQVGPTFVKGESSSVDKIRRGAVWFINTVNTGYHVDFMVSGIRIEAWTGERRVAMAVHGKVTEATLNRDLSAAFMAAGLTDLARSNEVRAGLFRRPAARNGNAKGAQP